MLIKEIMTKGVIGILPDTSLDKVGNIIKEKRISGLPVVDENFNILGIVTITDMLKVLGQVYRQRIKKKENPDLKIGDIHEEEGLKAKVGDIMSKNVFTLEEDGTIDDVMGVMFDKNVHTIPITKNGKLVGIVGKRDLIHTCF